MLEGRAQDAPDSRLGCRCEEVHRSSASPMREGGCADRGRDPPTQASPPILQISPATPLDKVLPYRPRGRYMSAGHVPSHRSGVPPIGRRTPSIAWPADGASGRYHRLAYCRVGDVDVRIRLGSHRHAARQATDASADRSR